MLIIPANTLASGGFAVDNSCRFNPSSSDYLSRTNGTPTNAKKFTWSAWFKKTTGAMNVAGNKYDASNYAYFYFRGTDDLRFFDRNGGVDTVWISDMLFRDTSAWYHLVISVDTTQSTDTNRFKVYVNGVQDTGDKTFIKDINHLPPAHIIKINLNDPINSIKENWWKPEIYKSQNISFKYAVKNLRELFLESIKLHLRSDVPLGIALSGGIDSSAIACCVKYLEPKTDIHTFSYIPNDNKISEEPFIDIVNNHIKAIPHKIYVNSNELKRDIKDLISTQ